MTSAAWAICAAGTADRSLTATGSRPWLQPVDGGSGPVISVNSWGYTGYPGMAGPILWGSSAECLLLYPAADGDLGLAQAPDGDAGVVESGCF